MYILIAYSGWHNGKASACPCRRRERCRLDTWVGKMPWSRKWQPTLLFLPGKFHGKRSLVGYNPCGCKESDMTEHTLTWEQLILYRDFKWFFFTYEVFNSLRSGFLDLLILLFHISGRPNSLNVKSVIMFSFIKWSNNGVFSLSVVLEVTEIFFEVCLHIAPEYFKILLFQPALYFSFKILIYHL